LAAKRFLMLLLVLVNRPNHKKLDAFTLCK
jgi:hypothetical protein